MLQEQHCLFLRASFTVCDETDFVKTTHLYVFPLTCDFIPKSRRWNCSLTCCLSFSVPLATPRSLSGRHVPHIPCSSDEDNRITPRHGSDCKGMTVIVASCVSSDDDYDDSD
jgi:hypothetical protein